MKKITLMLIMLMTVTQLAIAGIPDNIDQNIRAFVKRTYDIETYGSSGQKMMYQEEVKSYLWLQKNAVEKEVLKRVMKMYPLDMYGYNGVKMMYEEEVKNSKW